VVTVAILSLNEEDRIEAAIRSASFAEEVLVLDSGSTDGTVERARALGARVVETDWPGFVEQRMRALSEARCESVFFLDADETIGEELAVALAHPPAAGRVLRRNHWLGRPIRGGAFGPTRVTRLCRKGAAVWEGEGVHEVLRPADEVTDLPGALEHHPYRSLDEHHATIDRYATLFATHSSRQAHWWDIALRPPLHFVKALLLQRGFVDGTAGVSLAWLGSVHVAKKWWRLSRRTR
jgi:glycosyltransferase involved in cell wall biosynthesis